MFIDNSFMLKSDTAKKLYDVAKQQPIYDFHCHLDPKEIYENKPFENIVDIWLSGDHYKWRLMRADGVPEKYITGDATDKEKFKVWAKTVGRAIGNPLFHFTHLEMSQVFGINEHLHHGNWEEIYDRMNKYIQEEHLTPRKLIQQANVKFIGTTDHPLDDLKWHKKLSEDQNFEVLVAPTFRPDETFVSHINFSEFIDKLEGYTDKIVDFDSFSKALEKRIKYFVEHGARASDLSLGEIVFENVSKDELDSILKKARQEEKVTTKEIAKWQTGVLLELCRLYKKYELVTQIHFGALRNNSQKSYQLVGSDTGFDSMRTQTDLAVNLNALLNELERTDTLPKMIWYNLNPMYNTVLANTLANFQSNNQGIKNKLQFGAAWWFADNKTGMLKQMEVLANQGMLANFVGMLTDSRSFLSYQRHDYFRRILCSYLGEWIEDGEIPSEMSWVTSIVKDICYENAKNFFKKEE
ncbi:glucuronate isomerase [Dolosigranulum pigrum]|uniref:glucuronate isomerase n=1 Tax=Dolosigranulum pigrum TaxID=29394 RepID=UPI00191ABA38|nr:glucuronate isomerase [Dolosigranulum pigrum]QTJ42783.1 glucuronate isomerase [Dolosigranulum pigrum]QTJ46181.1 glucuronate isomerase [Dolosigranulum pigrum]QTJ55843.1 glucuronate isomerase [Dolosigranulum pigrum]QTJ59700.1 glucuronate isomerase [Dolosigranulum pigrum]